MAINLEKVIYSKIEDGAYEVVVNNWDIKQTKGSEDYVVLACTIPSLNDRPVNINLFEKGLDIVASNVSSFLALPELQLLDILNEMKGKTLPAFHQTVAQDGKVYYNWYVCSTPRMVDPDEDSF